MSYVPPNKERVQHARPGTNGRPTFDWQLTGINLLDSVKLTLPPMVTLPIVFVPGIMGSNLADMTGEPVWLLDSGPGGKPIGLAWNWAAKDAGVRQAVLHPNRTKVYRDGDVPKEIIGTVTSRQMYLDRGWGEVSESSYHKFLFWLEAKMNAEGYNPAKWQDFFYTSISATPAPGSHAPEPKLWPGITMKMNGLPPNPEPGYFVDPVMSDDLLKRSKFRFPVYACGYNWLASNVEAAKLLQKKIDAIIKENNVGSFKCNQVILVTHSMGGLVARFCTQMPGMQEKIVGVVHGVMPTVGAPVAYRRCKIGMWDEDGVAALVIGTTGQDVTAVFSQAPGALQLLPSEDYRPRWLIVEDTQGKKEISLPISDPYEEIYLIKDRWWGLVKEEWLSPQNGVAISWDQFRKNINLAKAFHRGLSGRYHTNTYVYYGSDSGDKASFETVLWKMKMGIGSPGKRPSGKQVIDYSHSNVRESGNTPLFVGGETKVQPTFGDVNGGGVVIYDTSLLELHCSKQDGKGDGTVPSSSGMAPRKSGGVNIRQQFRLTGFLHEASYQNATAQRVTHYAITKICSLAKT